MVWVFSFGAGAENRGQVSKLVNSLRTSSPTSPTSTRNARLVYRLRFSILRTRYKNTIGKYIHIYLFIFVRVRRIELRPRVWKTPILPLNYTRKLQLRR